MDTKNPGLDPKTAKKVPKKVIVAVHGIGEHFRYETIQAVARQFCRYYKQPAAIPLGMFYSALFTKGGTGVPAATPPEGNGLVPPAALVLCGPPGPDLSQELGFAEVYWASIPHAPDRDKYLLEESQKWGKTVVERLRLHYHTDSTNLTEKDCQRVGLVLTEMIEAVAVMERVFFLAEKATSFRFDLKKVLVDHLGDVQLVTEFEQFRDEILAVFNDVMNKIAGAYPDAEIHIVAHSEGTVIAFLGMLRALNKPTPPNWANMVRGFMTIGSPINKHLILWPELWTDLKPQTPPPLHGPPIKWINYYDYGDPIGFELTRARDWMNQARDGRKWSEFFNFAPDIGFSRYPFPGKAHNDYWNDDSVFKHFIKCVVKPDSASGQRMIPSPTPAQTGLREQNVPGPSKVIYHDWGPDFIKLRPRDRAEYRIGSYVMPYLGIAAIFFMAVFLLYKAVWAALHPYIVQDLSQTIGDVAGITSLLAGITIAVRIPHLTGSWLWRVVGFLLLLLSGTAYCLLVDGKTRIDIGEILLPHTDARAWIDTKLRTTLGQAIAWIHGDLGATSAGLGFALLLVVVASLIGWRKPRSATKWLIVLVGATVFGLVFFLLIFFFHGSVSLWPVIIAGTAFLYLWWLGVLAFDLVFIWHRYIRFSAMVHRMDLIKPKTDAAKKSMRGY